MSVDRKNIFLADDDADDCELFGDALREVCTDTMLTMANDGHELMDALETTVPPPPHMIFLDLNMPRKNGFECLAQIRATGKLKNIPVIIFSTSSEKEHVDLVYEQGADYYMCKPHSFNDLKSAISQMLSMKWSDNNARPARDKFLLSF